MVGSMNSHLDSLLVRIQDSAPSNAAMLDGSSQRGPFLRSIDQIRRASDRFTDSIPRAGDGALANGSTLSRLSDLPAGCLRLLRRPSALRRKSTNLPARRAQPEWNRPPFITPISWAESMERQWPAFLRPPQPPAGRHVIVLALQSGESYKFTHRRASTVLLSLGAH
ncbi:hypothetical protein N657DRAFT_403603 [Parathielavia appendiculata]|uniref:Uncharacterized protein n=1 Tax=Parathielavia appendiculata TaxID=2587402 RepID=A0AAN6TPL9_9PEZI|nr:hypothetical protein N657DRAFT_403603 [Parathielavia appendiculata]